MIWWLADQTGRMAERRERMEGGWDMASGNDTAAWTVWCTTCGQVVASGTGQMPESDTLLAGTNPDVARHLREGIGHPHDLAVRGRVTEATGRRQSDRRQSER